MGTWKCLHNLNRPHFAGVYSYECPHRCATVHAHTHAHTHTHTHTHAHTQIRTHTRTCARANTYTIHSRRGRSLFIPLGEGSEDLGCVSIKFPWSPEISAMFLWFPLIRNWRSIFIVLLHTLLATTDSPSVLSENHVIPLESFTHRTQETKKWLFLKYD